MTASAFLYQIKPGGGGKVAVAWTVASGRKVSPIAVTETVASVEDAVDLVKDLAGRSGFDYPQRVP